MKTVVVTGASQGLGLVIAETLARKDRQVIGTGRSARPDGLDDSVEYRRFDASDPAACADFWSAIELGNDDQVCLVNNAGGYVSANLVDAQPEDYASQMQSNYFAGVYMTKALVSQVARARIVNIISDSALAPHVGNSAYGAAKAAARHFFQAIQLELPPERYQITNLYPNNIASHGPDSTSINPTDLAGYVAELLHQSSSYYVRDATLHPTNAKRS